MSEQETDLDLAIRLFDLVETFEEYKEGLLDVLNKSTKVNDPKEARERVMKIVDAKKADLMKNSPEFKSIMDRRKQEAKMRADESRAIHKAKMAEATANANKIRSEAMMKAESARMDARTRVDDWVATTRVRKDPVEELENNTELYCPICVKEDKNRNIINDKPSCMTCFHPLVKKSELKNYNRAHRRRWKKRR